MPSLKAVCLKFIEQLRGEYKRTNDIIHCFRIYLGFIKQFSDERYACYTKWQREDMEMSLYNPAIDTTREVLETAWNYSRRGGKSRDLTVIATFFTILKFLVIWRATYSDQLGQAAYWFELNPFVEKVQTSSNKILVYNSPSINISVLSPGKVASREADILIYDEGGWCFNHLALYEWYKASRPMIAASKFKHIIHASTPARSTAYHEEWMNLKNLEIKHNTKFTSFHPWQDCHWITKEFVEQEREKHIDCPWYIEQNYECKFVVYGGAVFTNYITLGDPHYPQFPYGFLDTKNAHYAGVDFNGEIVGHYLVKIDYDDKYIYVLSEEVFRDLNYLGELPLTRWFGDPILSLEIETGLFNDQFADQCKRLGILAVYQEFTEDFKAKRIEELRNRTIIIDRLKCPVTYRNLQEASYDQNSRLPKLEKRTDQHGLDALIHAMHDTSGKIHFRDRNKKNIFGKLEIYNPIQHI